MPRSKLREARVAAGLTQQQLADRLGVPQQHIARWESDAHEPRARIAVRASEILGTTVNALWPSGKATDLEGNADQKETSMSAESPDGESDAYYKVERLLRDTFPQALKPQKAGVSVDVRLYFRERADGHLWGGLAFLDGDGKLVDFGPFRQLPLDKAPAMKWLLGVLCDLGFDAAPEHRTKPPSDE